MATLNDAGFAEVERRYVMPFVAAKTRAVLADLVQESPVDYGRLRQDWRMEIIQRPGREVVGVITNRVPYLRYVLRGHGWIYPVNKQALHWVGRGGEVFAASVKPVPPNNFVARVLARHSVGPWRFTVRLP